MMRIVLTLNFLSQLDRIASRSYDSFSIGSHRHGSILGLPVHHSILHFLLARSRRTSW